jgi:SulP family sulfate permease
MSNIMLAGLVLLTLAFLAPAFQWLPEAALAAIVINAMWGSADPSELRTLWHIDKIDFTLGLITLLVVLTFDLLPAMITGIVLSVVYTVYRVSFPARIVLGRAPDTGDWVAKSWLYEHRHGEANRDAEATPGVVVYRFAAPLIFSNAEAFTATGKDLLIRDAARGELPHTLVVDFEEVYRVDATGAAAVTELFDYARRYDVELMLARVHAGTRALLHLAGVDVELGDDRFHPTVRSAVAAAVAQAGVGPGDAAG